MLDQLLLRTTCRLLHFDMFWLLSGRPSTPPFHPFPDPFLRLTPFGYYKNNFAYKLRHELSELMQLLLLAISASTLHSLPTPYPPHPLLRTLTSMQNDKARGRGSVCQARRVPLCSNIKAKKKTEEKTEKQTHRNFKCKFLSVTTLERRVNPSKAAAFGRNQWKIFLCKRWNFLSPPVARCSRRIKNAYDVIGKKSSVWRQRLPSFNPCHFPFLAPLAMLLGVASGSRFN